MGQLLGRGTGPVGRPPTGGIDFGEIFKALGGVAEVFGSLRKAGGAQEVGFAQAQAAGYWAAVARNNQILAERAAEDTLARGRADVARR